MTYDKIFYDKVLLAIKMKNLFRVLFLTHVKIKPKNFTKNIETV